jgi:putative MATE family efflux protein
MRFTQGASENKMGTAPVGKHLLIMSLPLMLSMLFEALYNVVDSLFVSHVSEKALTAVSLAFPIQLLVVSITVGTAVGINAILSRFLGEKNQKGVDNVAYNGIFLAIVSYIVFLLFGLFLTRAYFEWQSNDAEIVQYGVDYLSICMVFSFGASGQIAFQRLLQSTGKTGLSMVSQLVGACFNIIFDPILIFGLFGFPAMGTRGAAIATVAGQIIALGIAVFFNLTKNKEIHFRFRGVCINGKMIAQIYRIGVPAIITQALNSVMAFGVNLILIQISSTVVAAFGIYIKVQNFIFMPAFGVNNGVIAMTAYNYGAKNKSRIDQTIKSGMIYVAAIMIIGIVIMHFLASPIMTIFGASAELMSIGVVTMRVISLGFIFTAFTLIAQGVYNALGNGMYSLIITLCRVVIILLPVLYIFAKLFTLNTIWWAFNLAEAGSAIVGAILLKRIYVQKVAKINENKP